MAKVIGIDLGTTNSVVAVMEGGEPKVITNAEPKSISRELTFEHDLSPQRDREQLSRIFTDLCTGVSADLQRLPWWPLPKVGSVWPVRLPDAKRLPTQRTPFFLLSA